MNTVSEAVLLSVTLALAPVLATPSDDSAVLETQSKTKAASVAAPESVVQANEPTPQPSPAPTQPSPAPTQPSPAPTQPPPPATQPLPPPTNPVPVPPDQGPSAEGAVPAGQWVYTTQYGWVWMPYGDAYTYAPPNGAEPVMYVYYPAVGWTWVVAPWLWGWGPMPFFGFYGPWHFAWYGRGHWYGGRWNAWHGYRPAPPRSNFRAPRGGFGGAPPRLGAPRGAPSGAPSGAPRGAPRGAPKGAPSGAPRGGSGGHAGGGGQPGGHR